MSPRYKKTIKIIQTAKDRYMQLINNSSSTSNDSRDNDIQPLLSFRICRNWIVNKIDHSPLEWAKVKCKYTNQKPMYDFLFDYNSKMFSLYFTIYKMFSVEICMIFTLTLRIGQDQM